MSDFRPRDTWLLRILILQGLLGLLLAWVMAFLNGHLF